MSCYLMLRPPHEEKGVFHHPPFYPKKQENFRFFLNFGLPNLSKPIPNRVQESSWPPLGPSWALLATRPQKKSAKSSPRDAKKVPNPSQNHPKTLPKPTENRLKNAPEKSIVLRINFFTIFSIFHLKIHRFFT